MKSVKNGKCFLSHVYLVNYFRNFIRIFRVRKLESIVCRLQSDTVCLTTNSSILIQHISVIGGQWMPQQHMQCSHTMPDNNKLVEIQ